MQSESVQTGNFSWVRTIIIGRNPRLTAVRLVVVVVAILLLRAYVLLPIQVDGPSMLPNYRERSINVVNRLAYLNREPQRGDVVAIRFSGTSIMLMKRVVGMPGETVEFVNGKLVINGRPMDEPYVKNECTWDFRPPHWQLGDDEYYVVGDNRAMPYEDHKQGAAKRERIVGKVML
ncbi:MAG TPA: signal peptidase I [Verrucomicrobiae bacterium]|nr:signal peptidase I [Verrucomicrobiae bacterium]